MALKMKNLKSAFVGLIGMAVILVLAEANRGRIGSLENVTNFLTSPPVWLCFRIQTPLFVVHAALLIYGALLGWLLEWPFKARGPRRIFLSAAVFAGLILMHRIAQIQMEGALTAALKNLF